MISELMIRRAAPKDAAALADLEKACFSEPWSQEAIAHDIEFNELVTTVVAAADKKVIGYISVQILLDECDIRRVAVLPDYQNMKVGSILMNALINLTESAGVQCHTLEVRDGNEPARKLYEKFGFQECGRRKDYYGPGSDAILMTRIGDPTESDPARQA